MSVPISCFRCVVRVLLGICCVKMSEIEGTPNTFECECFAAFMDSSWSMKQETDSLHVTYLPIPLRYHDYRNFQMGAGQIS